jgi:Kef-type K+ transport system membrane component KefB
MRSSPTSSPSLSLGLFVYLALLVVGIGTVLAVLHFGNSLNSATPTEPVDSRAPHAGFNVILHVFGTLATVILLGSVLGHVCKYIRQPPVIGEVIAGLLLGPSLLGMLSPEAMHALIPTKEVDPHGLVTTSLKIVAQLGIVLYMFLVGLELNAAHLKKRAHSAIAISHASIVVPFVLGAIMALWLFPILSEPHVAFSSFALFMGVAMSITAFPVLARILTDRNLQTTQVGTVALSCAAADDVTAWCLLALVVGVAKAETAGVVAVIAGAIGFIVAMFFVVRPIITKWLQRIDNERQTLPVYVISGTYILILVAASMTEWIGIHAIFGAFLLGVIIPSESKLATSFLAKLKEPVTVLLLPAFFAYTGMRTEIGLLGSMNEWLICGAIILVATLGKFGGTFAAARFAGESWREASVLGILMNTRGLMELIVLNIGLDMGVISPKLFAMMVLMALVTTMMTSPILQCLMPSFASERSLAAHSPT